MAKTSYTLPKYNLFKNTWSKRLSWAAQHNIGQDVVYPIYKQDANRLVNNQNPIGDEEAIRMMLAAKYMRPVTPEQNVQTSSPGNLIENAKNDAANIASGLDPVSLIPRILGSVEDVFKHPSHVYQPIGDDIVAHIEQNPDKLNKAFEEVSRSPAGLIPGLTTLSALNSTEGRHWMTVHPVSTLLDVLPYANAVGKIGKLADLSTEEKAAGIATKDVGTLRQVAITAGERGTLPAVRKLAASLPILNSGGKTLGDYGNTFLGHLDMNYQQRELIREISRESRAGNLELKATNLRAEDIFKTFSVDDNKQLQQLLEGKLGHPRKLEDISTDSSIPAKIRTAFNFVAEESAKLAPYASDHGKGYAITLPDGTLEFTINQSLSNLSKRYQEQIDTLYQTRQQIFNHVSNISNLETAVRRSIPELNNISQRLGSDELLDQFKAHSFLGQEKQVSKSPYGDLVVGDLKKSVQATQRLHDFLPPRFSKITKALENRDWVVANDQIAHALKVLRHKDFRNSTDVARYVNLLDSLRYTTRLIADQIRRTQNKQRVVNTKTAPQVKALRDHYYSELRKNMPARWAPLVNQQLRQQLVSLFNKRVTEPAELEKIIALINTGTFGDKLFIKYMPEGEIRAIENEIRQNWMQLKRQGYDPLYVPWIRPEDKRALEKGVPIRLTSPARTPTFAKARRADLQSYVEHSGFAVSKGVKEMLEHQMAQRVFDWTHKAYVRTSDQVWQEAERKWSPAKRDKYLSQFINEGEAKRQFIVHELGMEPWEPDLIFRTSKAQTGLVSSMHQDEWIPHQINQTLKKMMDTSRWSELSGVWEKATNVFRFSVLNLSPRFLAHIFFGGLFMFALEAPLAIRFFSQAWDLVHNDKMPIGISRGWISNGLLDHATGFSGGRLFTEATGHRLGLNMNDPVGKVAAWREAQHRFTETISDMYRTMAYLDERARKLRKGATAEEAEQAGIFLANKVLADLDSLSPIERNLIKKFLPFYSWNKHLLRFVFTMPIDHPLRVAYLSRLANQEVMDQQSGLPRRLDLLFFTGSPDPFGNVNVVDVRAADPIRDVANLFHVRGWIEGMNPLFLAGFKAFMNYDPVTGGSAELHPELTFNDIYGTLQSKPGDIVTSLLESYIPQTSALFNAFNKTSSLRTLRTTNPSQFRQQIGALLNVPWFPYVYNLKQKEATTEKDLYLVAKQATELALTTGDFDTLKREYGNMPIPFQPNKTGGVGMLTADQIQKVYNFYLPAANSQNVTVADIIPSYPSHHYFA